MTVKTKSLAVHRKRLLGKSSCLAGLLLYLILTLAPLTVLGFGFMAQWRAGFQLDQVEGHLTGSLYSTLVPDLVLIEQYKMVTDRVIICRLPPNPLYWGVRWALTI